MLRTSWSLWEKQLGLLKEPPLRFELIRDIRFTGIDEDRGTHKPRPRTVDTPLKSSPCNRYYLYWLLLFSLCFFFIVMKCVKHSLSHNLSVLSLHYSQYMRTYLFLSYAPSPLPNSHFQVQVFTANFSVLLSKKLP